ncbi:hypothetical protein JEQ12_012836 [Ovis aries]|uniref:Uncharacterized protein n=1 Tax=Ovis aries TaxID=9940 RepID=A0A836CPY1_SHEEP|nr:hypothetical protein JEQ12_012836 [Ovis aries]
MQSLEPLQGQAAEPLKPPLPVGHSSIIQLKQIRPCPKDQRGSKSKKILQMLLLWFTCLMASEVSLSAKDHRNGKDREREKGPGVGVAELWVLQLA